ncbi:MAG: tetratricopeptide repeat protein [Terriglobales bacterium]|jgi:tetratricopeptide (TPR) repeat protein
MKKRLPCLGVMLIFLVSSLCAEDSHHHLDSNQKLGTVSFPTSCANSVQKPFERGVALLHSFWYDEADKQFQQVADQDPQCAIAYWGQAMSLFHQLWSRPEESDLKQGWDLIRKGQAIGAKTKRERDYIDALAFFYRDYDKLDHQQRCKAYSQAMEKIYHSYPKDQEAAVFYALSLLTWAPDANTALGNAKKSIAILNPLFAADPNDPGVAHYLIHAADDPRLAQLGLPAARRYAQIAPASPHALHMPSHIFARLGLWQEDIQSNLATIAATQQPSAIHFGAEHRVHSMDFLEYAYLQIGEDSKAEAIANGLGNVREQDMDKGLDGYLNQQRAHFPAMYALERHQWKEALALQPPLGVEPENQQITYWARAVGAGHLRDAAAAQDAVNQFDAMLDATRKGKHPYRADRMSTNHDEAHAWLAFAQGRNDDALKLLRTVADKQDAEGKGEVELPAREMLADMLLEMGQPEEALAEYERSMKTDPNRFNGLAGAGRAAELLHQTEKAKTYYAQLLKNCDNGAHSDRVELAHARSFSQQ